MFRKRLEAMLNCALSRRKDDSADHTVVEMEDDIAEQDRIEF
jgi:hypothetical protein